MRSAGVMHEAMVIYDDNVPAPLLCSLSVRSTRRVL